MTQRTVGHGIKYFGGTCWLHDMLYDTAYCWTRNQIFWGNMLAPWYALWHSVLLDMESNILEEHAGSMTYFMTLRTVGHGIKYFGGTCWLHDILYDTAYCWTRNQIFWRNMLAPWHALWYSVLLDTESNILEEHAGSIFRIEITSSLKIEAMCLSETFVSIHRTAWCCNLPLSSGNLLLGEICKC
jgi:hypothetical protein